MTQVWKYSHELAGKYILEVVVPECRTFAECVANRLLPTFDSIGKEALDHGEEVFRSKVDHAHFFNYEDYDDGAQYAAEEEYKAAEYFASKAMDETFAFADMLVGMFYSTTALYSAGLFHLFEQHAATLRLLFLRAYSKEASLTNVTQWLKKDVVVDVEKFSSWDTIYNDLRLVANAVKHAEGWSATDLRCKRPDLFVHPRERTLKTGTELILKLPVRKPLFGEDIYITPDDFQKYSDSVLEFWNEFLDRAATAEPLP